MPDLSNKNELVLLELGSDESRDETDETTEKTAPDDEPAKVVSYHLLNDLFNQLGSEFIEAFLDNTTNLPMYLIIIRGVA